jgi:protease I
VDPNASRDKMTKNILLITGDFGEDYDIIVPYQGLQMVGYDVDAVCPEKEAGDRVKTSIHDFRGDGTYMEVRGHDFALDATLADVDPAEYDALYLPGGRAPEYLREYDAVIEAVGHFFAAGKPVGALCHGQQILTAADVVEGYEMTSHTPLRSDCEAAGATWVEGVTRDRNLVTAQGWDDHPEILEAFIEMLGTDVRHADQAAPADD